MRYLMMILGSGVSLYGVYTIVSTFINPAAPPAGGLTAVGMIVGGIALALVSNDNLEVNKRRK